MNIIVILMPISLILGGLALAAFLWTLRSDQYDDLEGDAMRILQRDDFDIEPQDDDPAT